MHHDAYPEAYKGVALDEPFFGAWRGYGKDAEKAAFLDSIKVELDRIYLLLYSWPSGGFTLQQPAVNRLRAMCRAWRRVGRPGRFC